MRSLRRTGDGVFARKVDRHCGLCAKRNKAGACGAGFAISARNPGSVANGDAGNIGALQRPAYRLGLVALEAGEPGAEQFSIVLGDDRLGERIGLVEQAARLTAGEIDALARLAFALERADLDDPSGMGRGGSGLAGDVLLRWFGAWRGVGIAATACGRGAAGTLDAGNTPRMPLPVPKLAGCGGISLRAVSLTASVLATAALATTALDVSATSGRAGMALVTGGAGCDGSAEASFICPALTCTVFTRTGFIGSAEPGIADIGWVWITPEVKGAGSGLACGSTLAGGAGRAAAACAISDGFAAGRGAGAIAAIPGSETAALLACTVSARTRHHFGLRHVGIAIRGRSSR